MNTTLIITALGFAAEGPSPPRATLDFGREIEERDLNREWLRERVRDFIADHDLLGADLIDVRFGDECPQCKSLQIQGRCPHPGCASNQPELPLCNPNPPG